MLKLKVKVLRVFTQEKLFFFYCLKTRQNKWILNLTQISFCSSFKVKPWNWTSTSYIKSPDSVWPHRRQPTRLPWPWDSQGKNTVVGCHFLLQCMKVKSESEVAQSCLTLSDPMDCSLPGSSVHGIFQARVLEWGAIAFSNLYHSNTY